MELLEHLINERPVLFARYVCYFVFAVIAAIMALKQRKNK